MIYKYVVVLKNLQGKYINLVGIFLCLMSIFCFARELFYADKMGFVYLLGALIVAGLLVYNLVRSKQKKKVYYHRALLMAGLVWMKMPYWQWLIFVFVILAILEHQAKYDVEIGFADEHIRINTLFKKKYSWSQFNNVILKDGIITLDFTDNRVLQREILDDDEEDEADEAEFNAYCRSRLFKHE